MRTPYPAAALLLLSTLSLAPGCDEASDEDLPPGEVTPRCFGAGCSSGPIGNTSRIGDHDLSNMAVALKSAAPNNTAGVAITGGTAYYNSSTKMNVTQLAVDDDGQLRLQLDTAGWIAGTQVKNAVLNLLVTPYNSKKGPFTAKLWIADVRCSPGQEDSTMTICRYEFVTDVVPADVDKYPMHDKYFGYYHTCPLEDEGGALGPTEKFSAVLSPGVRLTVPDGAAPSVDVSRGSFINGCINGAVSKGQYYLNAFYDANAYRGLEPSQRTPMLLMWMAWFAGGSRTLPGKPIWPHDPIGGLFSWTSDPEWDIEAGYGADGAMCRGAGLADGLHRNFLDPVLTLAGWSTLPPCTATTLDQFAVLGVKVHRP